jgi:LacI family transcriptional regulator
MNKKTTIKDIAKAAQVSTAAVSLALNKAPGVGPETRKRIFRIAAEMNYRPNSAARSLVVGRSHTIGLIVTTILNPFYAQLAKGIEDKASELGYSVFFCSTNEDLKREEYHVNNLRSRGVDGIIFSCVKTHDPIVPPLLEEGFPFVLVNRKIQDPEWEKRIDSIVLDNFSGAYQAMAHLYKLGHRRIGILGGSPDTSTAAERTGGAKKFLKEAGCRWDPSLYLVGSYSRGRAYKAAQKFLAMENPPTAIFSQNDCMALAARDAILDAGWKIPEDIALVGFDDIAETALKGLEITTVTQKKYEMGMLAVKVLVEKINQTSSAMANQVFLQPELIVRKSCGAMLPSRLPNGWKESQKAENNFVASKNKGRRKNVSFR